MTLFFNLNKFKTGGLVLAGFSIVAFLISGCASKPFANYNQGIIEMNEGNATAAETLLLEELVVRPDNAEAWNQLGIISFERGHWSSAAERFRSAYDNNELNPAYARNLGLTFAAQQQYEAAIEWYEISLAIDPKNTETLSALAKTQYLSGDVDSTKLTLDQLLMLEPTHPDGLNLLARLPNASQ
jgi:tetratricopeptide (TPR) repeat protein